MDLAMAKLIKLANVAGVMHEADHAYSIQSTWWLHRLATDVPFIACVINLPWLLPITWNCRMFGFILWSELSYVRVLTICLLLVYFAIAAGCHCFDFISLRIHLVAPACSAIVSLFFSWFHLSRRFIGIGNFLNWWIFSSFKMLKLRSHSDA